MVIRRLACPRGTAPFALAIALRFFRIHPTKKKQTRPIITAVIGTTTATINLTNDKDEVSESFESESKAPGAIEITPREVAAAVAGDANSNVVKEAIPPPEALAFSTNAHSDIPTKSANAWSALTEKAVGAASEGLVIENGVASVTGEAVLVPHSIEPTERGPVKVAVHAVKTRRIAALLPLRYLLYVDAAAKPQPEQSGIAVTQKDGEKDVR